MAVRIERSETVYKGWLKLLLVHLRGDKGETFERIVEDHGSGVAVLPYDPGRRVALMVRLPRTPVMLSGATEDLIEVPAGLLDDGEAPADAARREAFEEAGVRLTDLEPIGVVWTMAGISTERMHMFLAPYAAAQRTGKGGGLAAENENITVEEIPLDELARLADANALADIRALTSVLTLRARHPELFV